VHFRDGIRALMLLVFLLVLLQPSRAQPNRFEGKRIMDIRVESATQILDPSDLSEALEPLQVGKTLDMADVRLAIERLYAMGRFEDVAVDASDASGGVLIRFLIEPAVFVRDVEVQGVREPPTEGQMVNATKLALGERFTPAQLRSSSENLLELLRANGFYLAKVTPETSLVPFQQIDIRFNADTGERAKYSRPVIKGTPNKTHEEIVRAAGWKKWLGFGPWKSVTEARTQQGLDRIRRLYRKRDYLMARVALEQMGYEQEANRVAPVISIDSGPQVRIQTTGAKISRGRLRELVPVFQEQTVDKDLLVEGQREITEYFQAKGFFDTQVDFEVSSPTPDEQLIEYIIYTGDRHKLVHIEVDGNRYFDDGTIRERLYITPATFLRFRRGRYSDDLLKRDINAIRALYQSNGFRDVEITAREEDDYLGKENEVAVFIEIEEGPQWFVSGLKITGVEDVVQEELRSMMQSLEGQPYSELNVATDQETILNYFFTRGYPDVVFEPVALPAGEPNRMSLTYTIRTGERQFVRQVLISGLQDTDPELVRERIRYLNEGDPLSLNSMIESQRRLYDLGIFARVDTALQNADGDTDHKFVLYRFEEASRYSLTGGFGAQIARIGRGAPGTFDSPAGAAGFSPRISFGISRSNFLGIGHTLSFQGRLSNIQQRALVNYLAPQFKGNDDLSLTLTALFDDSQDVQTFDSRRREGSVQLTQRLTKANTAQYRAGYRHVRADNIKITPSLVPALSQPIRVAFVSGTFIQDRRDDPIDPHRGIYNTIDGALASSFFGVRTSFVRGLGRNATYHRVGRDLVIARQLSFGLVTQLSEGVVPLPERFFAGGAVSHRGFPDNQAGPRDPLTGFPVGGKALLINNTELRFPLLGDNVGGVFFHDAGNVYSDVNSISFRVHQRDLRDFNYMVHAVGFGLRYRTPIGPVRLDFAYSINSPRFMGLQGTTEQLLDPNLAGVQFVEQRINQFQFHFSLGQLF
jgi:outer membrane protein assembly complex protein YaeT